MARPKSDNPKRHRLELRLTDDELDDIVYISKTLRISKSEAILDAVLYRSDEIRSVRKEHYGEDDPFLSVNKSMKT